MGGRETAGQRPAGSQDGILRMGLRSDRRDARKPRSLLARADTVAVAAWTPSPGSTDGASRSRASSSDVPSSPSCASSSPRRSSMANGACSTIASKMPRVMLCKTRELGGAAGTGRVRQAGRLSPPAPPPLCVGPPPNDPATHTRDSVSAPGREQRLPTGGHPEKPGGKKTQAGAGPPPLTPECGQRWRRRAR